MSFTTKSRCEWFKSCIKPTHSFFLSILFISKEVPRALFQGAEVIEKQVEKERKIPLIKAASKLHIFSFLSFQRGADGPPAEIHSSYHLGVNRAYGTATERVDFPSSLPHTTGIEEVVLSSFLKRMSNLQTEGIF